MVIEMLLRLSKPISSLLILMLLGFIWGTGYSIARFAMTNGVPPLGYSFWQSVGPAIVIGFIVLLRKNTHKTSFIPAWRYYLISGLTGIVIPNTVMYFSAVHLPAGILAMIVNTVPVIAYPLALFVGIESFHWQRLSGVLFAFTGLMFIIFPESSLPSPDLIPWVLLTLITPFSFAICSIYIARYRPKQSDALTLASGMLMTSSLILIPLVFLTNNFYTFHVPLTLPDWIIIFEIALSSIGYLLFFQLIKIAGPVYYSLVDTIVVLTGVFWGYILFHEKLNQWTVTAIVFIILALLMVTQQQRKIELATVNN